jgi:hypothetical protein
MASKATIVHKVAADQAASRISFMAAMEAMLNCSLLLRYQGMPAAISGQVWVSWESLITDRVGPTVLYLQEALLLLLKSPQVAEISLSHQLLIDNLASIIS